MRVLVTGAAGYFGRQIIPALLSDARFTQVIGTDRVAAPASYGADERYTHVPMDMVFARSEDWEGLLNNVDLVYHLAFQLAPRPNEDMRPTNVDAQALFLKIALAAPRRVIVASAIAVYGFPPGRDPISSRLDEATPFFPGTGVAYADHKQALEALLDQLEPHSPATVVRARPTNVAGAGMPVQRAPLLSGSILIAPVTAHPLRQQLLHEEDLARAFLHLIDVPAGAYNIAPDDWMTLEEASVMLGQRYMRMPPWMLRPLADIAWRTGRSVFDATWLNFLENPPIIVGNDKLRATGWAPRFSTKETLQLVAAEVRRS